MGKFYYCGISTVRRQIKSPRTSRKRKFNLLLLYVLLFFVLLISVDYIIIVNIEGLSNIEVLI